jgi:RHS repeat-associated protein
VLDPLAVYDRDAGVVLNGDGTGERADRAAYRSVSLVAGWNGTGTASGYAGDGTKAVGARLSRPDGVAVAPDGTIYIADPGNGRVRRVGTDGIITSAYGGARCPVSSCRPVDVAIGSDGSLYVADTYRYQVLRIAADGAESVVAGNGTVGYSGDNGPATLAQLAAPTSLAVGPDDAVWIKDTGPSNDARIRRVAPDGTITTAMGAGPAPPAGNPFGDGLPADQIRLGNVGDNGLAVGPDGTVYVVDYQTTSFVRAITPDGIQHRFAGAGPSGPGVGDGKSALDATISQARSLAVGPDGSVYIGEAARLRRVAPDGTISTVAGDGVGQAYSGDDGPAGSARVWAVAGIAVAPDGGIVFADRDNHRVRVIRSVLANTATGEQALASRDGTVVYRFDAAGRHTETVDGLTGATLTRLAYDSAGRLATITDRHGLATTVEHDAAGSPTAIVAPGGQRTTLSTDASGYLTTITDPVGATIHLTSTGSGLLTTLGDRRGNTHTFTYDPLGLLSTDTDPAGGTQTLTRTILTHGAEVAVTTTLGRQTLYRYELQADGSVLERTTTPSGAVTETLERPDGTIHTAYPDGAVEDLTTGPDPRFGERVPITTRDVLAEPAGPTSTTTMTRTATTEPGGGIATLTDTTTRNGAAWTTAYTGATRTIVTTSPAGRTTTTTLNAQDDITAEQQGTLAPVTATYDARGRLATITQGALNYTAAHDAADNLIAVTDALGAAVHYTYDASGRRVTETTPSGRVYTVTRDASGNIDTLAMPGATSDKHVLSWDTLDRIASYTAPGRHSLTAAYDADRELATITEPGGATIVPAHDAAGRETSRTSTDTVATTTYVDATDRVAAATNAPSSGPSQTSAYEYTGDLPTRDSETGAATGDIRRTFSNDLDVAAWSLDGVASTVTHDADRLVTGDGPWAWTFDENGLQTATTGDPGDVIAISRDGLGRVTRRTVTVNGVEKHRVDISYDNAGRVATRTDTVAGTPASRTYTHDVDGRLTAVAGTGETSAYTYDLRDNLTGGPGGAIAYTGSDLVVGDTYDEDGRLGVRGGNTYTYTTRGDLTTAVTAAGPTTYAYDASGRRVTRTHAGVTTTYLYANPSDPFQLSASKQGATTTVYRYDDAGALAAFEVGAARYLVATDQVGSPLAAYDAATGAPYLTRTYDAYGRQLAATGPADFPIGYAGGLADPNTGLVRFGYRDYDPATGRFTAPDPTLYGGGQYNLYTYVNADPATETDRSGTGAREFAHNYVNLLFDFVDHPIDTTFWVLDRDLQATRSALKSLHKACSSPPPDAGPLLVPPPPPTYPTQRKGGSRRTPTGEPEFRSILH